MHLWIGQRQEDVGVVEYLRQRREQRRFAGETAARYLHRGAGNCILQGLQALRVSGVEEHADPSGLGQRDAYQVDLADERLIDVYGRPAARIARGQHRLECTLRHQHAEHWRRHVGLHHSAQGSGTHRDHGVVCGQGGDIEIVPRRHSQRETAAGAALVLQRLGKLAIGAAWLAQQHEHGRRLHQPAQQ
jgi:hypothetical protein